MNRKILSEAKNILSLRRMENEKISQENKQKALKNENFRKIYQNYVSLMIENAKNGNLEKEVSAKKKECDQLLAKLKIGSIDPTYSCPKCNDEGYINGQMCNCLKKEITALLMQQSGFTKLESFDKCDFSRFDNPPLMKAIFDKMQEWCNMQSPSKTLIFLSGGTGVGKTHLIKCMANELIKKGSVVNLVTAFSLNQDLVKAYSTYDSDAREQILQKYLDCEYLFIDDLGTEIKQKGLTVNIIYLILNERKIRGLATIITSNLNPVDIRDQYDERISSRIIDKDNSICLKIDESDIRLKKLKK